MEISKQVVKEILKHSVWNILLRILHNSYYSLLFKITVNSKWILGHHWKKWSHFDLKSWVTGGTKIRTGIPSKWRIFESNWLDIESQIDSISSKIDSILRVKLTRYWELNWLDIENQIDSILRVNFTQYTKKYKIKVKILINIYSNTMTLL